VGDEGRKSERQKHAGSVERELEKKFERTTPDKGVSQKDGGAEGG